MFVFFISRKECKVTHLLKSSAPEHHRTPCQIIWWLTRTRAPRPGVVWAHEANHVLHNTTEVIPISYPMSDHLVAPHCWGQQLLASTRYRESRAPRPGIVWCKSFMTMLIHSTVYFPYILAAMMCLCIPAATPPSLTWLNFVLSMCPTWRQYQDAFFLDGWLLFQQVENWPVCSLWSCPCSWKIWMNVNS